MTIWYNPQTDEIRVGCNYPYFGLLDLCSPGKITGLYSSSLAWYWIKIGVL